MRTARMLGVAISGCGAAAALGQSGGNGPDLIASGVADTRYWTTIGGWSAYSLGFDACNAGTSPLWWEGQTTRHPVVTQNIYRLKNNRFVQIGQGWLKHGHSSANANNCAICTPPPGGSTQLGVGCSDTYAANLNGWQILLGPRSQVNATTGDFPYPWSAPPVSSELDRRVQVAVNDVIASNNPGALYFAEIQCVAADDARANNGRNNASYQQITFPGTTSDPVLVGDVHRQQPAIAAWKDLDPGVTLAPAEYTDPNLPEGPPIVARFWVGAKASDNGDGTWHYEYAVHNLNSDRGAGSFSVPVSGQLSITNLGFHHPPSHSGEPYSNAPWDVAVTGDAVTFATTPYASDPNANAIRWGTLYNFRFDASTAPTAGTAVLGLFKPGNAGSLNIPNIPVPSAGGAPPLPCYPNCDNSSQQPVLNVTDFTCFLDRFYAQDPWANCDGSSTPPAFNILDFTCFLRQFAAGCP
jgi:hypothetical protein